MMSGGADGPGWWSEVAPGPEKVRDGYIVRREVVSVVSGGVGLVVISCTFIQAGNNNVKYPNSCY